MYMCLYSFTHGSSHQRRYIGKKLFLKISQYLQENTCAGVSPVAGLRRESNSLCGVGQTVMLVTWVTWFINTCRGSLNIWGGSKIWRGLAWV